MITTGVLGRFAESAFVRVGIFGAIFLVHAAFTYAEMVFGSDSTIVRVSACYIMVTDGRELCRGYGENNVRNITVMLITYRQSHSSTSLVAMFQPKCSFFKLLCVNKIPMDKLSF